MKIVKSAVKYKDEIFAGYGHEECFIELFEEYDRDGLNANDILQGFITDSGEFVNRIQATMVAQMAGQIPIDLKAGIEPLISEDMYVCWLHEKDKEIKQFKMFSKENEWKSIKDMQNTLNACEEKYKKQCKEIEQLKAHIADMEQEQIKIMQEHNEFYKQVQKIIKNSMSKESLTRNGKI